MQDDDGGGWGSEEGTSGSRHVRASAVQVLPFATPCRYRDRLQAFTNVDAQRI